MLLDAFGWAFVQRHADHPFLRRLQIEPVRSQFPSTTTAHLTTLYSGLPVTEHGLYEWRCYEPLVGDVIRPLRFALADSDDAAADHAAAAVPVAEHAARARPRCSPRRSRTRRTARRRSRARRSCRSRRSRRAWRCSIDARARRTCTGTRSTPPAIATARRARRSSHASLRALDALAQRRHAAARDRRPRPDRRGQDRPPRPLLVRAAPPPHAPARRLRARPVPARRRPGAGRRGALATRLEHRARVRRAEDALRPRSARACASASPTSACSRRPAGWSV